MMLSGASSARSFLLGGLLAAALVSAASASLYKEIRKWSVQCSNGLSCEASFYNWDNKGLHQVSLKRSNLPSAPVVITLGLPEGWSDVPDTEGQYAYSVDGAPETTISLKTVTADALGVRLEDPAVVGPMIEAMRGGKVMQLTYRGRYGEQALAVDLSGFSGSLLYIDEAQDRLDRADALVRKGDRPVPETVALSDIASLDMVPEVIRGDFSNESAACGGIDPANFGNLGGFAIQSGDVQMLVLPCGLGGAYNQPYALYVGFGEGFERTSFPDMRPEGPSVQASVYNLDYDPAKRVFTSFFKGRGIGDCGSFAKWELIGKDGDVPALVLKELRNKDDCDENNVGGPQNFPLVWPKP